MRSLFVLIFIVLYAAAGMTQDFTATPTEEDSVITADDYFKAGEYKMAHWIYSHLIKAHPKVIDYQYRTAACMVMLKNSDITTMVQYLEATKEAKKGYEDVYYFLAQAYHWDYRFEEAKQMLAKSKKNKDFNDNLTRTAHINRLEENCDNGIALLAEPVDVKITDLGSPVNTEYDEYRPVITSDHSLMMFTYRGERSKGGLQDHAGYPKELGDYYEDIFVSHQNGDHWSEPVPIGDSINTTHHEAAVNLSPDGQQLFIYKDTYDEASGELYLSKLKGDKWTHESRLGNGVNSINWESSACVSGNGKLLYFSSDRYTGFGGRDIYFSTITDSGWSPAENVGEIVNTNYDEDCAFVHPDGKTLYFSSTGYNSMGGYDIFYTQKINDTTWTTPQNMGYPINTPGVVLSPYFSISNEAEAGFDK